MADAAKTSASSATSRGIVVDPRVMFAGGAVALIGLGLLAFFLWMVPNAAAREAKAACTGLRTTGPALCNGEPCELPMEAPSFTAYDYAGQPVDFKEKYKGKVVLLNFWASWCGVCKTEKPKLLRMAEDMVSDDFAVARSTSPLGSFVFGDSDSTIASSTSVQLRSEASATTTKSPPASSSAIL